MSLLRFFRLAAAGAAVAAATASLAAPATTSTLWGEHGESWQPGGRLPDFSRAGYHEGTVPLPRPAVTRNVRDFGAKGDGVTDDTRAIQAALAVTNQGALLFPPGRYVITDFLRVTRSGVVLRGAGADRTEFWFPRGLDEIHPKAGRTSTGSPASGYSFDGAFVTLQGDYQAQRLARITATAQRGDQAVEVDDATAFTPGQTVLVLLHETPDHSLKTYLYDGDPGDIRRGKPLDTKMLVRITTVEGRRVGFDRPLRFPTRPEWQPEIRSFRPTVTESGVEGIRFVFPAAPYRGHFKENGANALELRSVHDCWIRDVVIHNGDLGINVVACGNTLDGITVTADPGRGTRDGGVAACTGHHAIQCKGAEDNLVTRFDLQTSYVHDLSVEHASGNVFAAGRGIDLNFDHHKDTPYENLYTNIDCGRGTRVWRCGGGASIGRQSAGWETFWNIRAQVPIAPPPKGWGAPNLTYVGLHSQTAAVREAAGLWFEPIPPATLQPSDLHAAQLDHRLPR
jgi:hypothetical protein